MVFFLSFGTDILRHDTDDLVCGVFICYLRLGSVRDFIYLFLKEILLFSKDAFNRLSCNSNSFFFFIVTKI